MSVQSTATAAMRTSDLPLAQARELIARAVAKAEDQLAKAQAAGDARRISEAEANLTTRREWLAEAEKSSSRR